MEQDIPANELDIKNLIQKIKSNNPEEADLINTILQIKPQNVTPGLELLASNILLIIFETLNNLTINYLGENGEYYTRRLAASYFVIENLKKLGEITKKASEMEKTALASLDPQSNQYALTKQMFGQFQLKMFPYISVLKQTLIYNFEEHIKANTILLMLANIFGIPKNKFISDKYLPEAEIVEEEPLKGGSKLEFLKENLENIDFEQAIQYYRQFVILYNCQDADIISFNMLLIMNKVLFKPITKGGINGEKEGTPSEGEGEGEGEEEDPYRDMPELEPVDPLEDQSNPTTTSQALDFTQQSQVASTFTVDGQEYKFPLALTGSNLPTLELAQQMAQSEKALMQVVSNMPIQTWKDSTPEQKKLLLANINQMTSSQVEKFVSGTALALANIEAENFDFPAFQVSVNTMMSIGVSSSNYRVIRKFPKIMQKEVKKTSTITLTDADSKPLLNEDGTVQTKIETSKEMKTYTLTEEDIAKEVQIISDNFKIDHLQEIATDSQGTFIDTCTRIGREYADTTGGLSQLQELTTTLNKLDQDLKTMEKLENELQDLGKELDNLGVKPEDYIPGYNEAGRRYFQWLGYGQEEQKVLDKRDKTKAELSETSTEFIDKFSKILTGSDAIGSSMTEYSEQGGELTQTQDSGSPFKFDQYAKLYVGSANQNYCETLIPQANYHLLSTIKKEIDENGNEKEVVEVGVEFSYEPLNVDGQNVAQKTVYARAFLIQRLHTMIAAANEKKEAIRMFQKPEWKQRLEQYKKKKGAISEVIEPLLDNSDLDSLDYIISSASTLIEFLQFTPKLPFLKGTRTPELVEKQTLKDIIKINSQLTDFQEAFGSKDPAAFLEGRKQLAYEKIQEKERQEKVKSQMEIAANKRTEFYGGLSDIVSKPINEAYTQVAAGADQVLKDVERGAGNVADAAGNVGKKVVGNAADIVIEGVNKLFFSPEGIIAFIIILVLVMLFFGINPKQAFVFCAGILYNIVSVPFTTANKVYGISKETYDTIKANKNVTTPLDLERVEGEGEVTTGAAPTGFPLTNPKGTETTDNVIPDPRVTSEDDARADAAEDREAAGQRVLPDTITDTTAAATTAGTCPTTLQIRRLLNQNQKQINKPEDKATYRQILNAALGEDRGRRSKSGCNYPDIEKDYIALKRKLGQESQEVINVTKQNIEGVADQIDRMLVQLYEQEDTNGPLHELGAREGFKGGKKKKGSKKNKVEKKKGRKTKRKMYTKKKKGNSKKHKKKSNVKRNTRRK